MRRGRKESVDDGWRWWFIHSSSLDATQLKQKLAPTPKPQTALSDYIALNIYFCSFYLWEARILRWKFKMIWSKHYMSSLYGLYLIALLSLDSPFPLFLSPRLTFLFWSTDWNHSLLFVISDQTKLELFLLPAHISSLPKTLWRVIKFPR